MNTRSFLVRPGTKLRLRDYDTEDTGGFISKEDAEKRLQQNIDIMAELQDKLYAHDKYSLLLIFQAMDGGGKDSAIKHVMSGLNPQGTQVYSFKAPSAEERDHDYLWRINRALPEKGRIGIFNRSHYEEVLIVRVHNLIDMEKMPPQYSDPRKVWKLRYKQIRDYEEYLHQTGTYIIKFFLHISKEEQRRRFLKRIEDPSKNWKITEDDIHERRYWDQYQKYYEEAISETSRAFAPWYVIPGDKKWFARLAVSEIIVKTMQKMKMDYPRVSDEQKHRLEELKQQLLDEEKS